MDSPSEVTRLRKEGLLDEAYAMASRLLEMDPNDIWVKRAYAWAIYALCKQAVENKNYLQAQEYLDVYDTLEFSEDGEVLIKQFSYLKTQTNPDETTAWEIQKEIRDLMDVENPNSLQIRSLLNRYLALTNIRPSLVHSIILSFALKLSDIDFKGFNLWNFVKRWDLKNLRAEDRVPYAKSERKTIPSLYERAIQHTAKYLLQTKMLEEFDLFNPYLDEAILNFSDNYLLYYYKAKILLTLNRNDEALKFTIPVVKRKSSDYWTWGLLGDLYVDNDIESALSCYCKALLCNSEENFIYKYKLKLAEIFIRKQMWSEAKYEIKSVIHICEKEGYKIDQKVYDYQNSSWFKDTPDIQNNIQLYTDNSKKAEEMILVNIPWFDACAGDQYIDSKTNREKRSLYIKKGYEIKRYPIFENQVKDLNLGRGDAIKVQVEFQEEKYKVYKVLKRDGFKRFDICPIKVGKVKKVFNNNQRGIDGFLRDNAEILYYFSLKPTNELFKDFDVSKKIEFAILPPNRMGMGEKLVGEILKIG